MKKILVFIALILSCCFLISCSTGNDSVLTGGSFSNIEDYSNRNGYKNWYYRCGDVSDKCYDMVYSYYNGQYLGKSGQGFIQKDVWQPAVDEEIMAVFVAPENIKANVTVIVDLISLQEVGSDGVAFYITTDGGKTFLYSVTLRGEKLHGDTILELDLKEGEEVCFVLSALSTNSCDKTKVDIKINI